MGTASMTDDQHVSNGGQSINLHISGANRCKVTSSISNKKDNLVSICTPFFSPLFVQNLCGEGYTLLGLLIDNIWCRDQEYGEIKQEWNFLSKIYIGRLPSFETLSFSVGIGRFDIGGL